MKIMNRRQHLIQWVAGVAALSANRAMSDTPTPLRLLQGFPPGGSVDVVTRMLADSFRMALAKTVLVEHKLGAGQRIALNDLRRSAADGNTLFFGTLSPFTIYPNIYKTLEYDPVKHFTPIARLATFDGCIATGPATGAANIDQLIAWLKANPNKASYGTPGNGTQPHFAGYAFGQGIGVEMIHIPYRGGDTAMSNVVGGQIPMMINALPTMIELHNAGKMRIVAVTGGKRSALLPQVPTLIETGIPFQAENSIAVYGPPLLPESLVKSLNEMVVTAMHSAEIKTRLMQYGLNIATSSPAALAQIQQSELNYLGRIIKASGYVATT
jgi:tripartite-type tricarboxylate transporter receptor subunit TctC